MISIYRYTITIPKNDNLITIEIHDGARFLRAGMQGGEYSIWAIVDTEAALVPHHFYIIGTGTECGDVSISQYLGTIESLNGTYAYHIFNGGNTIQ